MAIYISIVCGLIAAIVICCTTEHRDFWSIILSFILGAGCSVLINMTISLICSGGISDVPMIQIETSIACADKQHNIYVYEDLTNLKYIYFTEESKGLYHNEAPIAQSFVIFDSGNESPKVVKTVYDISNPILKFITFKDLRQKIEYIFYIPESSIQSTYVHKN